MSTAQLAQYPSPRGQGHPKVSGKQNTALSEIITDAARLHCAGVNADMGSPSIDSYLAAITAMLAQISTPDLEQICLLRPSLRQE